MRRCPGCAIHSDPAAVVSQPAPVSLQVHGTSVALAGLGLLLRGPAGSGKSNLALRLIEAGAVLIADDLCQIGRVGGRLVIDLPAAVDAKFRGQIHIRGRGVLSLPYFGPATLGLVADLMPSIPDAPPPDRIEFLQIDAVVYDIEFFLRDVVVAKYFIPDHAGIADDSAQAPAFEHAPLRPQQVAVVRIEEVHCHATQRVQGARTLREPFPVDAIAGAK